jgi:hypothetical protein
MVWVESDPVTGAGVLTVVPVSLSASCAAVSMTTDARLLAVRE